MSCLDRAVAAATGRRFESFQPDFAKGGSLLQFAANRFLVWYQTFCGGFRGLPHRFKQMPISAPPEDHFS
jgi:hypothetical protein